MHRSREHRRRMSNKGKRKGLTRKLLLQMELPVAFGALGIPRHKSGRPRRPSCYVLVRHASVDYSSDISYGHCCYVNLCIYFNFCLITIIRLG